MFKLQPNYERIKARMDAFWEREILDRPVVQFDLTKPHDACVPLPASHHANAEARWLDTQYQAELHLSRLTNRDYVGDTVPVAMPNLGPEILSAMYGCPLHFGDYGTSWTDPILHDWADAEDLTFDWDSPWIMKLDELTDALLEIGRDTFITGMTDWHPGGDAIAALRDPQTLCIDMITNRDDVVALLSRIEVDYFRLYDRYYQKLRAADQPISTWLDLVSDAKYYIPSNDFAAMISPAMFADVFLPGIVRECQFLDRSIYHLDGPGCLGHLDNILAIPELHALQWVFGAGNEGYHRWVDVYRRVQAADKGVEVICRFHELPLVMETLDPHGLYLKVSETPDRASAEAMLRDLERWCVGKVR